MVDIIFYSQFIASKVGKTSLTVTFDLWQITRSSAAVSQIVTGGSATEVGGGVYLYRLANADPTLYDYAGNFKTADTTVDAKELGSLWTQFGMESSIKTDGIGAAQIAADAVTEIQSGLATAASIAALPTLAAIVAGVAAVGTVFPSGAVNFTYTVTNGQTLLPEPNVDIWISTDEAGTNVVWRGCTDVFGIARDVLDQLPALDPGGYYFWRQKSGFTIVNPDMETVS